MGTSYALSPFLSQKFGVGYERLYGILLAGGESLFTITLVVVLEFVFGISTGSVCTYPPIWEDATV